jgi:hypothetical protein
MDTAHSTATPTYEYQPTIIDDRFLIERLAIQIAFLRGELKPGWKEFKRNPVMFSRRMTGELFRRRDNSAVVDRAAALVKVVVPVEAVRVKAADSQSRRSNNEHVSYSSRSRSTRKKRGGIRSQA